MVGAMSRPPAYLLALALVGAAAPGCTDVGGSGASSPGLPTGDRGKGSVPIPGDVRRSGREGIEMAPKKALTEAEEEARRSRSVAVAEQLWRQAEAAEAGNPGGAADAYRDIAEDHPESPRAAEAKFREGRGRYRAHDYRDAFEAFRRYMEIAPTNQHLAEVEELVFESGKRYLASVRGFSGVFKSKDEGYAMLQYVAETFPNGRLADDALLALGDALYREEDKDRWIEAVQHYRSLLLRYPESDLRPAAHLGLAKTYLVRDQGSLWHGGYVDLDPREETPTDPAQMAFAGSVGSAPLLALEAYEALLKENEATPGRASAAQVAAAEQGVRTAKERLAAKDARIAAWYGGMNGGRAADPYRRSAAELRGQTAPPPLAPPVIPPLPPPTAEPVAAPPAGTQPPVPPPTPPPQPPSPSTPVAPPPVTPPTPPTTLPPPFPPTTTNPPVLPPAVPASLPPPKIRRTAPVRPG